MTEKGNDMLIICGYVNIKPADLPLFMSDINALAQTVRKRAGNLSYDVAVENLLAGRVLISERWKDQDALTVHLAAPHTRAFISRWQERMTAEILKYDALNERGLLDME